jgi:hypothetical protein
VPVVLTVGRLGLWEDHDLRLAQAKSSRDPISTKLVWWYIPAIPSYVES